jgi:biotin operon repressor
MVTPHLHPIARVPDYIPPADSYYPMRVEPSRRAQGMRTRSRILTLLSAGPLSAPAIAQSLGMTLSPVNKQLQVLEGGHKIERCGRSGFAQVWRLVPDRGAA